MDSPRQPPYEMGELEQWLEGVEIHKNPTPDNIKVYDGIMSSPNYDFYAARIEWDDERVTLITARKKLLLPRDGRFWHWFNAKELLEPYFAWNATFSPRPEPSFGAYSERAGKGYNHPQSLKIFKLMERLHDAQK